MSYSARGRSQSNGTLRHATFRGQVPLPWVTIAALAFVMAAADDFVVVSLRGAFGAIERAQTPFDSWIRESSLMTPLLALVVMWAFRRAHRKHGLTTSALRKPLNVIRTALLIAAAGSAVSIAALTASTAYDYHLQSALLERTAALHGHSIASTNGVALDAAHADGTWTPAQRQTLSLDVASIGLGSALIVVGNVVLVGWVVALRGGRLDVTLRRRRRAGSTPTDASTRQTAADPTGVTLTS